MAATKLLPTTTIADKPSMILYQRKMGSLLYAVVTTQPDITFAVFQLIWFNQNPSKEH